jgi:carboxylesterase type B
MTPTRKISIDASGTRIHGFTTASRVDNFLGIPFGRITKRFCIAEKVPPSSLRPSIDATTWGPRCPQSRNYGRERREYLYEANAARSAAEESETDCLNLNIFAPEDAPSSNAGLPVMVWIHGGGWVFGDGGPDYGKNMRIPGRVYDSNTAEMAAISCPKPLA